MQTTAAPQRLTPGGGAAPGWRRSRPARLSRPGRRWRGRSGEASFILFEVLLGVLIFAVGVLALGRSVGNCLLAETVREENQRARWALENRLAEIEYGGVEFREDREDKLEGEFAGFKLKQTRRPAGLRDEEDRELTGIELVTLVVSWESGGLPQSQEISCYVYAPR